MGADFYQDTTEIVMNDRNGQPNMGIGKYCYIEKAILDKNCYIGDNVRIIGGKHLKDGDYGTHSVQDGIIVVKKEPLLNRELILVKSREVKREDLIQLN
jgi:glucose-1-phosphate adenylyltransferase